MTAMMERLLQIFKHNVPGEVNLSRIPLEECSFDVSTEIGSLLEGYREVVLANSTEFQGERTLLEGLADYLSKGSPVLEDPGDSIDPDDEFNPDGMSGDEDTSDPPDDFDGPREDLPDAGDNGQASFPEQYPELDEEAVLEACYNKWLEHSRSKPFFKVITAYNRNFLQGSLNPSDRIFLWKLIKAISSTVTHLVIEVETHPESICLMDKYFDGLVKCLNSVVHASDTEDVMTSFRYMVEFLGISNPEPASSDEDSEPEEDAEI